MQEITTTPDYKQLLGRKILKLRVLDDFSVVQVGLPVLIFEAKDKKFYGSVEIETLYWKIYPVDHEFLIDLYQEGIYKIVGVGIPFLKVSAFEYLVAVQDEVREYFSNKIPF